MNRSSLLLEREIRTILFQPQCPLPTRPQSRPPSQHRRQPVLPVSAAGGQSAGHGPPPDTEQRPRSMPHQPGGGGRPRAPPRTGTAGRAPGSPRCAAWWWGKRNAHCGAREGGEGGGSLFNASGFLGFLHTPTSPPWNLWGGQAP